MLHSRQSQAGRERLSGPPRRLVGSIRPSALDKLTIFQSPRRIQLRSSMASTRRTLALPRHSSLGIRRFGRIRPSVTASYRAHFHSRDVRDCDEKMREAVEVDAAELGM